MLSTKKSLVFANSLSVNKPTMADFKLLAWGHRTWSWEETCIIRSATAWAGSRTPLALALETSSPGTVLEFHTSSFWWAGRQRSRIHSWLGQAGKPPGQMASLLGRGALFYNLRDSCLLQRKQETSTMEHLAHGCHEPMIPSTALSSLESAPRAWSAGVMWEKLHSKSGRMGAGLSVLI